KEQRAEDTPVFISRKLELCWVNDTKYLKFTVDKMEYWLLILIVTGSRQSNSRKLKPFSYTTVLKYVNRSLINIFARWANPCEKIKDQSLIMEGGASTSFLVCLPTSPFLILILDSFFVQLYALNQDYQSCKEKW
ncbi:Hypothetical predicted protein, partial [Paramuricea clavata]